MVAAVVIIKDKEGLHKEYVDLLAKNFFNVVLIDTLKDLVLENIQPDIVLLPDDPSEIRHLHSEIMDSTSMTPSLVYLKEFCPKASARAMNKGLTGVIDLSESSNITLEKLRTLTRFKMTIDEWSMRLKSVDLEIQKFNIFTHQHEGNIKGQCLLISDGSFDQNAIEDNLSILDIAVTNIASDEDMKTVLSQIDTSRSASVALILFKDKIEAIRHLAQVKATIEGRLIPAIILMDYADADLTSKAFLLGASEVVRSNVFIQELIVRVTNQIKFVLYRQSLEKSLQNSIAEAFKDPLTNLYNRRYLSLNGEKVILRMEQAKKRVAVVLLDVDNFKQFNDVHGHVFGDNVLIHFAGVLNEMMRATDLVIRYAGDEFMIFLSHIDPNHITPIITRLCEKIAASTIEAPTGDMVAITASIGYVVSEPSDNDLLTLIKKSDLAMYEAKARGRNCVVSYAEIAHKFEDENEARHLLSDNKA